MQAEPGWRTHVSSLSTVSPGLALGRARGEAYLCSSIVSKFGGITSPPIQSGSQGGAGGAPCRLPMVSNFGEFAQAELGRGRGDHVSLQLVEMQRSGHSGDRLVPSAGGLEHVR